MMPDRVLIHRCSSDSTMSLNDDGRPIFCNGCRRCFDSDYEFHRDEVKIFQEVTFSAAEDDEPVHLWFNLTYANYLCLPRSVLQSMPVDWQARLVMLLDELNELYGYLDWPSYRVSAVGDNGRFIKDPIPHYNRGRTEIPTKEELDGSS